MRYLQKYGSMACLVHGLIAAGLVESAEAPTEPETSEGKEDTTTTNTEPQEGTEDAQKTADKTTDMETFKKAYSAAYSHLYDHAHTPAVKAKTRIYSALFDEQWEQIKDAAKAFCQITRDLITSDRETAAFMIALEAVGTPTDGETATDRETTTTTPETDAQRATESAEKTADDTTPTAGDTEPQRATQSHETTTSRKSITTTTEGTQEGAQTAGTSEGGNPHTEQRGATERATAATGGSVSQSDRRTRPAAPQSHGTTKGIQRHHRPPKTAYRAIQSTATIPARYHHAQTTTSRGSPKICISWG